jgi:hypothetical protein
LEDVEVDARSLRKGLNLAAASPAGGDDDDTNTSGSVDKRAIIESLCGKSPERLVAARSVEDFLEIEFNSSLSSSSLLPRELYERLYDANFLQNLVNSLQDDANLSEIVSALVAHNRHEVMERTDYDGGSAEALGKLFSFHPPHPYPPLIPSSLNLPPTLTLLRFCLHSC